jgi:DNA invertase Pin-like site-specific DNA recombinase
MNGAILYLRYSTVEQGEGQSEQRQTQSAERWCQDRQVKLVKIYKDLGISGGKSADGRKGLKELLDDLAKGVVPQYLLIEDVDRLSRMLPLDSLNLISKILEYGLTIVSLRDSQTLTKANWQSSQSFLILTLKTTLANEEREKRIDRGKKAWKQKRLDSKTKIYTRKTPGWLTAENDKIEIIPEHAETVKKMFKLSSEGLGIIAIIRLFNEKGIKSFHGNDWNKAVIHNTLTSEAVLGHFQPRTLVNGKRIEDGEKLLEYFPRIIENDLFYYVQEKLRQRNTYKGSGYRNPKNPIRNNLFSGIIKCEKCDASLINLVKSRHGYTYLVCGNAHKHKKCTYTTVNTRILEEIFTEWFFSDVRFLERFTPPISSSSDGIRLQLDTVNNSLSRYVASIDELDGAPPKIIAQKIQKLEAKQEELEKQLQMALRTDSQIRNIPNKLAALADTIEQDIKTPLGRAKIASTLKDCIESIVVNPQECRMTIRWKSSLGYGKTDRIAWDKKSKDWWVANSFWGVNDDEGYRTLWCLHKEKPASG